MRSAVDGLLDEQVSICVLEDDLFDDGIVVALQCQLDIA
jgi:hypothetical protein